MARKSKTNKRKQAQASRPGGVEPAARSAVTRRGMMVRAGSVLAGIAVLGAGGVWAVNSFTQSQQERDLSRIGKGAPVVVQIHDPQCAICNGLQREARKALARLDADAPIYLVADLTQTEGAIFAQQHAVQHVTLLLFDGDGNRVQTLTGSRTRDELEPIFARLTR
ncbi:MAG: hypothetical protein WBG95_14000 [Sulfitobacter sp.]